MTSYIDSDNHGSCVHCGLDLNGGYVYDTFLEKYGDHDKALEIASMYGARKGWGKWGKEIHMKLYDENYNKLPSFFKCPECGEKCYEPPRDNP